MNTRNPTAAQMPSPPTTAPAPPAVCPVCPGLECLCRPRYFSGQLLTETELNAEQEYVVKKNRLHNLYLHGWGVVCGLEVICHPQCAGWVRVLQGYAISPCGDDIILCEDVDFDVLSRIDECRRMARRQSPQDCAPWAPPRPDCSTDGSWYLTLEYQETSTRGMTALRPETQSSSPACTCQPAPRQSMASGVSAATVTRTALGAPCEPTRVCEGFRLDLCKAPEETRQTYQDLLGGTVLGHVYECLTSVQQLIQQAPATGDKTQSPEQLYNACCRWLASVRSFFDTRPVTHCNILDALGHIDCPVVVSGRVGLYAGKIQAVVKQVTQLLSAYVMDCICSALLPPCPADPGDPRLILACINVLDGRIVDICNWQGRRFALTVPALLHWLSVFPVEPALRRVIERFCCGQYGTGIVATLLQSRYSAADPAYTRESADEVALLGQFGGLVGPLVKTVTQMGGQ